jgi:hypothetical protein
VKTITDGPAEQDCAWPFAVSRTVLHDWSPVHAPQFMIARGGEYLLVHAADPGDLPCPSPVYERIVTTKRYGDLTLLARCRQATADLVGGSPQEQLRDRVGRPIQLIEGMVLPGRHPGCTAHWQHELAQVHAITRKSFPDFWRSEDEAAPPAPSYALAKTQPAIQTDADPSEAAPGTATTSRSTSMGPGQTSTHQGTSRARRVLVSVVTVIVVIAILRRRPGGAGRSAGPDALPRRAGAAGPSTGGRDDAG